SLTFENCLATTGTVYDFTTPVVYEYIGPGGCPSEWVVVADIETGKAEKTDNKISIYPNPSRDHLIIQGAKGTDLTIMNTIGLPVLKKEILEDNQVLTLEEMNNGIYFLYFKKKDKLILKRFVISR
ncbi:MAG: T9SS type A sorting domain-containing protein, partial [Bacteroidales bacterium]|nr:T9SS type A sorting domain-containing protein [Bacteroidales bacterium]